MSTSMPAVKYNSDPSAWILSNDKRRNLSLFFLNFLFIFLGWFDVMFIGNWDRELDVYYTDRVTKLSVENGVLIEEKIDGPGIPCWTPPVSTHPCLKEKDNHEQTMRTAETALKYYNAKHCTKYELVEPLYSNGRLWARGLWYHSNFRAKHVTSEGSSTALFFAELKIVKDRYGGIKYMVTACRPLDDSTKTDRCDMCRGLMMHPPNGYRQGLYEYKARDLRPRRNGKVFSRKVGTTAQHL